MRPETVVPLTLEEHRELAGELRRSRVKLHELCRVVLAVYGRNNPAGFAFLKVAASVDRLCGEMQAQVERDCPGSPVGGLYWD